MSEFLYELNSKEKFTCPSCEENNCFVKYWNTSTGRYLEGDYGRCDRENSCGYHKKPEGNKPLIMNANLEEEVLGISNCDYIPDAVYESMHKNVYKEPNILLRNLTDIFGKDRVLEAYNKYKLGTWHGGATTFPYYTYGLHTAKIIWFGEDMHRIKEGRGSIPQWLHNCRYKDINNQVYIIEFDGKHPLPLFGTQLIITKEFKKNKKTICIVESEKTAVVMSIVFPQYVWLATGGLRALNKWKFSFFQRTKVMIFPDMGIIKKENISVRDLWNQKINEAISIIDFTYAFVEYVPYFMPSIFREKWEDEGKDVLDFFFEYSSDWLKEGYESYLDYLFLMIKEAEKRL